jgi:peptidoglycan/LPS O-acetylase OafA/YrhL
VKYQQLGKKNDSIEGLRGLMILMIVSYHLIYRFNELYLNTAYNIFGIGLWGKFGRIVFLVISSYFLYSEKDSFDTKSYAQKKFFRIWPLYFISISLTFVCTQIVLLPGRTGNILEYFLNVMLINGFIDVPYVDGAHWYITILISLILVYGVAEKLGLKNKPLYYGSWIIVAVGCKIISKAFNIQFFEFVFKLLGGVYIGIACCGIILHMFLKNDIISKRQRNQAVLVFVVALAYSFIFTGFVQFVSLLVGLVLIFLCIKGYCKFFENPLLLFFGAISYPLYLCHQNISYVIEYSLFGFTGNWNVLYALIAFVVSVILAFTLNYISDCYLVKKVKTI